MPERAGQLPGLSVEPAGAPVRATFVLVMPEFSILLLDPPGAGRRPGEAATRAAPWHLRHPNVVPRRVPAGLPGGAQTIAHRTGPRCTAPPTRAVGARAATFTLAP